MNKIKASLLGVGALIFLSGCQTPFIDIDINGESESGSGTACLWPANCNNGGARVAEQITKAELIKVDENQTTYTMVDLATDTQIRIVGSSEKLIDGVAPKVGEVVEIERRNQKYIIKRSSY